MDSPNRPLAETALGVGGSPAATASEGAAGPSAPPPPRGGAGPAASFSFASLASAVSSLHRAATAEFRTYTARNNLHRLFSSSRETETLLAAASPAASSARAQSDSPRTAREEATAGGEIGAAARASGGGARLCDDAKLDDFDMHGALVFDDYDLLNYPPTTCSLKVVCTPRAAPPRGARSADRGRVSASSSSFSADAGRREEGALRMEGADESGGTRGTRPGEAPAQEETVPSSPLSLAPKGSADANVAQGEKERGRGDTAVGTLRLYDSRDALFAEETTAALPPPRCTTADASVSPSSCASPCAGTSGSSCSSSSSFSSLSSSYSSALGQGRATLRESLTGAAAAAAAWSRGEYQQGARGEPRLLCHPLITRCIFGPLAKARFYFKMHPSEAADAVVVLRLSDYLVSPEDAAAGGGAAEETQETCAAVDVSAVEREVLAIFRRRPQGVIVLNDLPLSCMALVRDEEGEEASAGGDRIAGGETGAAGGRGASARKNALVPFIREVFSASFFEEIAAPLGVSSSLAWTSSSASLYSAGKSRAKVKASPSARSEAHPPAASASAASRSAAGALRCGERGEGSENKGEASLSLAAAALAAAREVAREDAARQDGEFEREEERLARVAQKCSVRASLLRQNFLFEDEEEEENSDDWVDTRSDQSSPPVLLVMRRGTDLAQLAELEGIRFACVTPIPLRLGDHIYRAIKPRGILSMATHHGIYAGHGRVFHLSGNERQGVWALLANQRSAKVRVTSIRRFMGRGRSALRVKRYKEDQCDHPFTVMQRAEEAFVEQSFPSYHLLFNNCEHFAVFCKTGKGKSSQVQKAAVAAVATTSVLVGAGATAGATALAAAVLESRLRRL